MVDAFNANVPARAWSLAALNNPLLSVAVHAPMVPLSKPS